MDSLRRFEGESTGPTPGVDSTELPLEDGRVPTLRSLVSLLGRDVPGKSSPPAEFTLGFGVVVGSTDTTDRIGNTRSMAEGLIALNGDSGPDNGELKP